MTTKLKTVSDVLPKASDAAFRNVTAENISVSNEVLIKKDLIVESDISNNKVSIQDGMVDVDGNVTLVDDANNPIFKVDQLGLQLTAVGLQVLDALGNMMASITSNGLMYTQHPANDDVSTRAATTKWVADQLKNIGVDILKTDNEFIGVNKFSNRTYVPDVSDTTKATSDAVNMTILLKILKDFMPDIDLSKFAKLFSPLFQGNPRAPLAMTHDSSDTLATTQWVNGLFDMDLGILVFQNGLCLQWGTSSIPANYDSLIVPLQMKYDKGFICLNSMTGTGANPVGSRFEGVNSISLSNGAPNGATAQWLTIGYKNLNKPVGVDWKIINTPHTQYWNFLSGAYKNNIYGFYQWNGTSNNYIIRYSMLDGSCKEIQLNPGRSTTGGSLVELYNGIIFMGCAGGTISTNNGDSWTYSTGINGNMFGGNYYLNCVGVPNTDNILVVTTYVSGTGFYMYQSKNSGVSFIDITSQFSGIGKYANGFIQVSTGVLFCMQDTSDNLRYYLTTDSGDSFKLISTIPVSNNPFAGGSLYRIGNRLYNCYTNNVFDGRQGAYTGTIYYSDDEGYNWQPIIGIPITASYQEVRYGLDADGNGLWLHGSSAGIYKSSDGINFELLTNGLGTVRGLCFIENKWIITGSSLAPYYFYSLDGARTFIPASTGGASGSAMTFVNEVTKSIIAYPSGFSGGI